MGIVHIEDLVEVVQQTVATMAVDEDPAIDKHLVAQALKEIVATMKAVKDQIQEQELEIQTLKLQCQVLFAEVKRVRLQHEEPLEPTWVPGPDADEQQRGKPDGRRPDADCHQRDTSS